MLRKVIILCRPPPMEHAFCHACCYFHDALIFPRFHFGVPPCHASAAFRRFSFWCLLSRLMSRRSAEDITRCYSSWSFFPSSCFDAVISLFIYSHVKYYYLHIYTPFKKKHWCWKKSQLPLPFLRHAWLMFPFSAHKLRPPYIRSRLDHDEYCRCFTMYVNASHLSLHAR